MSTLKLKDEEIRKRSSSAGLIGSVQAKCTECLYDPEQPGTLNAQIAGCGCDECPLYVNRIGAHPNDVVVIDPLVASSKHWQRKQQLIKEQVDAGTLRGAVNAYCIDCIYDNHEPGSWRQQVNNCDTRKCPLYLDRAKSSKR